MNSEEKRLERVEYAQVLGNVVAQKRPLIYFDETTYVSQVVQGKSWSTRVNPNFHYASADRFKRTVYGVIGTCLKKPIVYRLEPATTCERDYLKFLTEDLIPNLVGVNN